MSSNFTESHDGEIKHNWQIDEVIRLFNLPFNDLLFEAHLIHRKYWDPNKIKISKLLNIKTGSCPEDCKYCPQSAHYNTGLEKEKLFDVEKVLLDAKEAKNMGVARYCMGAAWRDLHDRDLPHLCEIVKGVKDMGLETCMTLGMAKQDQLEKLKEAGLDYYNHNLDTSREYYPNIITTRTYQDRLDTLENVRNAGVKVCSGGIVGLGEKMEDRAKMLMTLANLPQHPESVPINLLIKIKGTPLENNDNISPIDLVKTIAVSRILMPKSFVRLTAGRINMSLETQSLCFFAGANSIFIGEKLLTAANPGEDQDKKMFEVLGLEPFENSEKFKETVKII